MKILVVDDDSRIRHMTADALGDYGHEVLEAEGGMAALALLDDSVDMLLTDVLMPGMTGPQLANAAELRFPKLMIRFMSGDTGGIPDAAFKSRPILAKPFTLTALLDAVQGA